MKRTHTSVVWGSLLATLIVTPAAAQSESALVPIEALDLSSLLVTPVVEAASRREQSIHDAPSSVTVITHDDIVASGASDVPDLLRRVANAHVAQNTAGEYTVGLRGISSIVNNRLLIVIDGRPMGEPTNGFQPWNWLPVNIAEIERIEVIRGPGSTLYGADAVAGVVSITTRRALDSDAFEGGFEAGLGYMESGYTAHDGSQPLTQMPVNASGYAAYNYRNDAQTVGVRLSGGLDSTPDWVDPGAVGLDYNRGPFTARGAASVDVRPNEDTSLRIGASLVAAESLTLLAADPDDAEIDTREMAFSANFARTALAGGAINLRADLDSSKFVLANIGPRVSNWRHHGRAQLDYTAFEGRNILTVGGEFTVTRMQPWTGVEPEMDSLSGVVQNELRLLSSERLILSAGLRFDSVRYTDGADVDNRYNNFNPRGAVIYQFNENHDVRVSAATAYRTPTPLELSVGASLPTPDAAGQLVDPPPIPLVVPNPSLEPERLTSFELGYRGELADRVAYEVVGIYARYDKRSNVSSTSSLPFFYQNFPLQEMLSAEAEVRGVLHANWTAYGSYGYTNYIETGGSPAESPTHILALGLDGQLPYDIAFHTDYNWVYDFDLTTINNDGTSPIIRYGEQRVPDQHIWNMKIAKALFDGQAEVYASLHNIAGFWRPAAELHQWTADRSLPIGATALLGMRFTFDPNR